MHIPRMTGGQKPNGFVTQRFSSRISQAAEELEGEFDLLQAGQVPDPQGTNPQVRSPSGEVLPPTVQLREMYDLEEIGAVRKGVTPQSTREGLVIHGHAEQPGAWDPADILRIYQIS